MDEKFSVCKSIIPFKGKSTQNNTLQRYFCVEVTSHFYYLIITDWSTILILYWCHTACTIVHARHTCRIVGTIGNVVLNVATITPPHKNFKGT